MSRVSAVVFDSHDNSLVMQFDNGGIRRGIAIVEDKPIKKSSANSPAPSAGSVRGGG